jgi:hypothetical protein
VRANVIITSSLFENGVVLDPVTYAESTTKNPVSSVRADIVKSANAVESVFFEILK